MTTSQAMERQVTTKPRSASQRLWQGLLPLEARQQLMKEMQDELEIDIDIKAKIRIRRARGRPSKYREEHAKVAYNLFTNPSITATTAFVCKVLGISRDTFYRWKRENEEFAQIVEWGQAYQEANLCHQLLYSNIKESQEAMHALKRMHHWI